MWKSTCKGNRGNRFNPASLRKFDDWYFEFYPYLFDHIPFSDLKGMNVLEVGLGYGTVSQLIAASGANYTGLDIAEGPVAMVNHRLEQQALSGVAVQGSILAPPFEAETFDKIIAIGCLHHTGDLAEAISRCYRLLRPGGSLIFMVYYSYSYRRWLQAPKKTLRYLMDEIQGKRSVIGVAESKDRAAYDTNSSGRVRHILIGFLKSLSQYYARNFLHFSQRLKILNSTPPFQRWTRSQLLKTRIPSLMGLDLYATATKS